MTKIFTPLSHEFIYHFSGSLYISPSLPTYRNYVIHLLHSITLNLSVSLTQCYITCLLSRHPLLNSDICFPSFITTTPFPPLSSQYSTLSATCIRLPHRYKFHKLSNLCTNFLRGGILPLHHPLPLISDKPSLVSYQNLTTS